MIPSTCHINDDIRKALILLILFIIFPITLTPNEAAAEVTFSHSFGGWASDYNGPQGKFLEPFGIAVLKDSNIIVSDPKRGVIEKFKPNGAYIGEFTDRKNIKRPMGLFVDSKGMVFVADLGRERVLVFNSKGVLLKVIGKGRLKTPTDVATDSGGNIYIADMINHNVKKFKASGEYVLTVGPDDKTTDIKSTDASPPAPKQPDQEPSGLDPSGLDPGAEKFLEITKLIPGARQSYGPHEFRFPNSVAIIMGHDGNEELYISAGLNSFVSVYTLSGMFKRPLASHIKTKGGLKLPSAVTTSGKKIYITDFAGNKIITFTMGGRLVSSFGKKGIGSLEFQGPTDIAVDKDGKIYIVDSLNRRIKVFNGGK